MAIKTLRVFAEYTSTGFVPMPTAGGIDYGYTLANTFPSTTPSSFQTDDPDIDVTVTAMTDFYVWIRISGTAWNPSYTRNVRVYPDSPDINNVVMNMIIATGPAGTSAYSQIVQTSNRLYFNGATTDSIYNSKFAGKTYINELNFGTAPQLSTVATSGAYADLTGKPALSTVATSGSYADLSNKPSGTAPISYNSGTNSFQISVASASTNGYLTSTDWSTFNAKYLLPSGGTTAQYLRGDGTLATFPTTLDSTRLIFTGRNSTGSTLTKGTVVYINGVSGNTALLAKAIASGDSTSAQTLGVIENDIANNATGTVVLVGAVGNLDTSSFTEGVQLYLSGTVAGAFTSSKVLAPTHLVYVGIVTRAHPTLGTIEVKIQNGYELDEIHDVQISSPANKDILYRDSATSLWKHASIASVLGYTPYNASNPSNYIALTALSASAPLSYNNTTGAFTISQANTTTNGFLSSTDWNTFNNKQSALTLGNVSEVSSNVLMFPDGGTGKTIGNLTIQVVQASASTNGYLSSTDWTTFNSKQGAVTLTTTGTSGAATFSSGTLNIPQYQTALTNPVTGTGTANYVTKWTSGSAVGNSVIFDNGTHVGIGTTTPNFTSSYGRSLSILAGTGYAGIEIFGASATGGGQLDFGGSTTRFASISGEYESSTNGYLNIRTLRGGTMTDAVRISANGNVGIGVVPSAWWSGFKAIQVGTTGALAGGSGVTNLGHNYYFDGTNTIYLTSSNASFYQQTAGQHIWYNSTSGTAGATATFTERMRITSTGNLGVGTSSPSSLLHLNATGYPAITIQGGATAGGGLRFLAGSDTYGELFGEYESANNGVLLFRTRGSGTLTERMRITSAGNVEIRSAGQLIAYRSDNARSGSFFCDNLAVHITSSSDPIRISSADRIEFYTSGTERMRITSGGNVEMNGTLHVDGSTMGQLTGDNDPLFRVVSGASTSTRSGIAIKDSWNGTNNTSSYVYIFVGTGSGEREAMRIVNSGNILMGTTTDNGERLYVSGAIRATGNITANSDLILKKNLKLVDNPIDKLNQLNGYLYQWKENDEYQYGVIAQEVEKILPHAVQTGNNGIKGVAYNQLIPLLIEGFKVQQKEINELKSKIG